jgi:DNA ligase D
MRLTSPDRVYYPKRGFTKRDVFGYYLAVEDGIMRALRDRPTTLERWPQGVVEGAKLSTRQDNRGDAFYQKRVPKTAPDWLQRAEIAFPSGRTAQELCPTDLAHVAWAAQMGTIVFHPWPVRRTDVENPDEMRIDLDPQPGTDFSGAVEAAEQVREVLGELGAVGWPKTSGGRGVHVYVRIQPRWTFTQVRRTVIALAREVERRRPELVTTSWWKEERGERVFVDYNQMARDRTIACAYSLRANQRATVSTPVTWDELTRCEPDDFDLGTVPARLAQHGDPHAGIDDHPWDITRLLEWAERDERDGKGDMPYPPDHPKMPGEPRRVQPSRNRELRR